MYVHDQGMSPLMPLIPLYLLAVFFFPYVSGNMTRHSISIVWIGQLFDRDLRGPRVRSDCFLVQMKL